MCWARSFCRGQAGDGVPSAAVASPACVFGGAAYRPLGAPPIRAVATIAGGGGRRGRRKLGGCCCGGGIVRGCVADQREAEARVEDEEAQVEKKAEGGAPVRLQEMQKLTTLWLL